MTKDEAKDFLRRYTNQCFVTTKHCRKRMRERTVCMDDVLNALMWGKVLDVEKAYREGEWKCKVSGKDVEGEPLVLIVIIDLNSALVLCKTVHG